MKLKYIIGVLALLLIMVGTASAGEVTITFDEGLVDPGEDIGNTYSDMGVTFSAGAKIVDTEWGSGTDYGFWNPDNQITIIDFSPVVKSVSIEFEDAFVGNMDAILVNGELLSTSKFNVFWTDRNLKIVSNEDYIKSVQLSDGSTCVNWIKYDNLIYDQIPEFPTIAAPVAAIVGLMFVFGRRKQE
ncbi:MAG: PEF-CTERM sorting domain-containing protein [Methanosarcina sp.]|uniref:PEF-CTERM sorting domain-containing protein n=1 Tax=Methanosarcina sp. TaxID=2213 RepID=UPI0026144B06|nr:PEF-CTERM sorting domain-containing protein [Methanosarcina sp.]MDD3245977.1 PEF-CTERM sorting domain-containing protein [Methanosarcina sp.]